MQEVSHSANDARQTVPGTAIAVPMLRAVALTAVIAATSIPAPAGAAGGDDSGRMAWVTDGDTFRLESGEGIRIAGIDAPETHRDQAKCAGETLLGLRAKDRATALLVGREVTFRRVGRSHNRTVTIVVFDGHDLSTELVRIRVAAWWPCGRPKPVGCECGR